MTKDKLPATYWMIGAGGTGSILFPSILRYLDSYHRNRDEHFNLAIVDGDTVEDKNFDRQLFAAVTKGHNKAEALVQANMLPLERGKLFAVPEYLGRKEIAGRINSGDTILIAVDNYSLRAMIEDHAKTLADLVVINGGNEDTDGSCQLYIRAKNKNLTPPLSHCHPEIVYKSKDDRAAMSCQARAKLPGGGQTIIANMASAVLMLNMLRLYHEKGVPTKGHEVHFDLNTLAMRPEDWRGVEGWN